MLIVADVLKAHRHLLPDDYEQSFGIEKLNYVRSSLPAITHVDYSARIQTVGADRNPLLHQMMTQFYEKTDCPVMINTSFNVRSEPIVCTPEDAFRCFQMTDMDVLVIGHHVIRKTQQVSQVDEIQREEHLKQFQLD